MPPCQQCPPHTQTNVFAMTPMKMVIKPRSGKRFAEIKVITGNTKSKQSYLYFKAIENDDKYFPKIILILSVVVVIPYNLITTTYAAATCKCKIGDHFQINHP